MTSVIRVGQSKFVATPIDEDSQERIMTCIQTLSQVKDSSAVTDIFLHDTKAAFAKMVAAEEVLCLLIPVKLDLILSYLDKGTGGSGEGDQSCCYSSGRCDFFPTVLEEIRC